MNVLRIFAFQDRGERPDCMLCPPADALPPGRSPVSYIHTDALLALDATLAAADARGICVVLTLVNNWDDFGGMNRWTLWRYGRPDHDRFYTDPTIRAWFRELLDLLVSRRNAYNGRLYRDDPTIFSWQLANEARLESPDADPRVLDAWIAEMSAYLKSIDPNHMVSTGLEGFYGPELAERNTDAWMAALGSDFIANHRHDTIDYASCHVWPQNWHWDPIGRTSSALTKASLFVATRLHDARRILGKPLFIEEFGIPRDNHGRGPGSGGTTIRNQFFREVFYRCCETCLREDGACVSSASWIVYDADTAGYDDGHGIFLPEDTSTDEIMTTHAREMADLLTPRFASGPGRNRPTT
jgi:mannan endo-1,4-beta-mannosidase